MFEGVLSLLSAGKGKASAAAAARTCGVKKEGLCDAGWLQLSGVPGKADGINRALVERCAEPLRPRAGSERLSAHLALNGSAAGFQLALTCPNFRKQYDV